MLLLLLIYVVLRALWKIAVHLISTFVNKTMYYYNVNISILHIELSLTYFEYHCININI